MTRLPVELPRYKVEIYHDAGTFHNELTLTQSATLLAEQGSTTFQWMNNKMERAVRAQTSPCNSRSHMTTKVTWQVIMSAKDKVLEKQQEEERRLQGLVDQEKHDDDAPPPGDAPLYTLSLPSSMTGVNPFGIGKPAAKKALARPVFARVKPAIKKAPSGDSSTRSSKTKVVKEEGEDKDKDQEKRHSKKALLAAATPNVNLEAIAFAGANIIGKNCQKGKAPEDCPDGHRKWYVLVSVLAVLMGEQLKSGSTESRP